jgi:hypothetical protein
MSRRYNGYGSQNVASGYITICGVTSATTIRPEIRRLVINPATLADNVLDYLLQRYTAAGTSTSFTPHKEDNGDPAALAAFGYNHTAEPTYTSGEILLALKLYQKVPYTHEFFPGEGFKLPATAANGAGLQVKHASMTDEVQAQIGWAE